jgi:hypothetical protein
MISTAKFCVLGATMLICVLFITIVITLGMLGSLIVGRRTA